MSLLNAFAFMQKSKLYHGRVKPENILIVDGGRIVICDIFPNTFDYLSREYRNKITGSLHYQAPEWIT